jgi:hypothetical protein
MTAANDTPARLSAERVETVFADCLAPSAEDGVTVQGVVRTVAFDPAQIQARAGDIAAMLAELPDQFRKSGGGGWSFLNACEDRHGTLWTGMHQRMEELFMLGLAAGQVTELMPRELWDALPGGMPYYMVDR